MAFAEGVSIIVCNRRIVHRRNVQRDRGRVRASQAVIDLVGERIGHRLTAVMGIGERSVTVERERAVVGSRNERGVEVITIWIGVVVEDSRSSDVQGRPFGNFVGVIDTDGIVVDGCDVQIHGGRLFATVAVTGSINKSVTDGLSTIVRVTERAIDVQNQDPMGRRSHQGRCQNISVSIVVIFKYARSADDQRATFLQ